MRRKKNKFNLVYTTIELVQLILFIFIGVILMAGIIFLFIEAII